MSELNNEEKLKSTLKSIYRPVRVPSEMRERVLRSVFDISSNEAAISPRFFLFRQAAWVTALAVIALILISCGIVLPPG